MRSATSPGVTPRGRSSSPCEVGVPVAGVPEVAAQLSNQAVAVDQHRAPPATLAEHGEVLIIGCEVDVLDLEAERLADAEAQLGDQAEEQPIAAALGGDGGEDRLD